MPTLVPDAIPLPLLVPESQRMRARARECRELAQHFRVDFAREHMLRAADDFERIAWDAQEREITGGMSQLGALVSGLHRAG